MGIDLKLLPFDGYNDNLPFSDTILSCCRRTELFDMIRDLEERLGRPVSNDFKSYLSQQAEGEGYHFDETIKTLYGKQLKYIFASNLLEFVSHCDVQDNWENRAIWAYLSELPATAKVALYWH